MTAEHLLGAYIDTNIVLLIIAFVWFCAKHLIKRTSLRTAYLTQLHILYGLVAMVVISPLIAYGVDVSQRMGLVTPRSGLNVSDFLVAQYLDGNIAMAPTKFQQLLSMRTELIQ